MTLLGLVCEKMTKRVELPRQEEEDRWTRQETTTVSILLEEESGGEKDKSDDDGTAEEREIWQVTAVTEEDLETTEGEAVDLYDKLMELAGWKVVDNLSSWVIERPTPLVSLDRASRGGAIPLEEVDLLLLALRLPSKKNDYLGLWPYINY